MKLSSVVLASVCTVLLAASVAVPVAAAAQKTASAISSERAYKALVSGRSRDAIRLYAEAIESRDLGPELLAHSLLNRALAFQNVAQHQDAIDDYSAALRVDALSAKLRAVALYNRGLSYQKIEKPAMAIEDFTNALFLDVEFSQAYYSRGNVLRRSGQYLFALSDYEKSMKYTHPEPHLPLYGTALTYEALRRPREAQKALVQALTLQPNFIAAREKLSKLIQPGINNTAGTTNPARKPVPSNARLQPSPENDAIVTGSILAGNPDMVMRKAELPAPVSPPVQMKQAANTIPVSANFTEAPTVQTAALIVPELPVLQTPAAVQEKPEIMTSQMDGWTVQLSSQKREDAAWSAWKKMQKRHQRILSLHEANVVRADLGDRGIFYRLRVTGLSDKGQANKLCARLKKRGTSCFVARVSS